MSTNAKVIIGVIVVVILVGGVWWWLSMSSTATAPTNQPSAAAIPPPTVTPTSTQTQSPPQDNGISATDNSNAGLQTDLSNIDGQMNGFSSDNASVSQGFSDQPVQQSQF